MSFWLDVAVDLWGYGSVSGLSGVVARARRLPFPQTTVLILDVHRIHGSAKFADVSGQSIHTR